MFCVCLVVVGVVLIYFILVGVWFGFVLVDVILILVFILVSDSSLCFFDGLVCPSGCQCLADLDKPVCSVGRCSRMVLARAWKIFIQVSDV